MTQQTVMVYISQDGGEVEDLQDLVDGKEVELDWVGSLNGQDVPIKVRVSDEDPNEDRRRPEIAPERARRLLQSEPPPTYSPPVGAPEPVFGDEEN